MRGRPRRWSALVEEVVFDPSFLIVLVAGACHLVLYVLHEWIGFESLVISIGLGCVEALGFINLSTRLVLHILDDVMRTQAKWRRLRWRE